MDEEEREEENKTKSTISQVVVELDTEAEWMTSNSSESDIKLEPPEIPQFVDNLKISEISSEIETRLGLLLDLPSVGDTLRNWEWLAFSLGMSWEEIKYLRIRAQHPSSPTSELLWRYRGENFGRVLRLIRDNLNRFDAIVDLLPSLLALEESLKLDKKGAEKCERQDSGVLLSGMSNGSMTEPSTSTYRRSMDVAPLFNLRVSRNPIVQNIKNATIESKNGQNETKTQLILVTYFPENDEHVKQVKWLCKNLKQSGANVVNSQELLHNASDDLSTGFTSAFNQAACIIVVCSPGYRRCVESNDCTTSCDVHWQYTIFLYKLMFAEYKELNCKNRRFRPVVFKGSLDADVPSFLKNTLIYKWPEQHESLMDFLFGDNQMNV